MSMMNKHAGVAGSAGLLALVARTRRTRRSANRLCFQHLFVFGPWLSRDVDGHRLHARGGLGAFQNTACNA